MKELGSIETMQDEVRDYLENVYKSQFIDMQYNRAVENGWIKVHLAPPTDFHLVVELGNANLWFEENDSVYRKVFVLEYSDFQCPFCKRVQETLNKLRERYASDVQFGYRHFPLPFHKEAKSLAEAAECARDQGKFWELQSVFYDKNSMASDLNRVPDLAKQVGVKRINEFKQCWMSGKYKSKVEKDINDGRSIGIQGTPTFILGIYDKKANTVTGEMFSGAVSEERFSTSIDKFLSLVNSEAKLNR